MHFQVNNTLKSNLYHSYKQANSEGWLNWSGPEFDFQKLLVQVT